MYDRENRFFTEDFDELRESGYLSASLPTDLGGAGLSLVRGQSPATAPRLPRAGHGRRRQHAPATGSAPPPTSARWAIPSGDWILVRRRRRQGVRRRSRRGRQRPAAPAVELAGRAGEGRLGVHRSQDLRQPLAGVGLPRRARDGHQRSGEPEGRARVPQPRRVRLPHRGDVGRARHAGDGVTRHDPRPRVHPRRLQTVLVCPAGLRRRRARTTSHCSPGPCSASAACTPAWRSGRSTRRSPACTSARRSR